MQTDEAAMNYDIDRLTFGPDDIDLSRSPLRQALDALGVETFVLGAFNPGLCRLPNGNLVLFVRVAEALKTPVHDGAAHMIRWTSAGYVLDAYPVAELDLSDPRTFKLRTHFFPTMGLTSLSWILPVEVSPDGLEVRRVHYDKAIAPSAPYQEYGIEDARVSLIDGIYYMTVCGVGAERHATSLYTSGNGLDFELRGLVLDHQNKDMLYFEGKIGGQFWSLTRPLGAIYFLYPPDSPFHAGPSINLATSPDGLHWKPHEAPFIRPRKDRASALKVGGGAQPIRTPKGWLILYHGVEPQSVVGVYRTFWALADLENPARLLRHEDRTPLLECNPRLSQHMADKRYVYDVVFTTGIVDAGGHYIVASGEDDLACRITHIPKSTFA
jgi:predicted GH43/DUF377 family glycosyl hydrolase